MNSPTLVHPEASFSTPSASSGREAAIASPVAVQADMSWVPLALAMFSLLVVTVVVTDTGEILRFAE